MTEERAVYAPGIYELRKQLAQEGLERTPQEVAALAVEFKCPCRTFYLVRVQQMVGAPGKDVVKPMERQTRCPKCGEVAVEVVA